MSVVSESPVSTVICGQGHRYENDSDDKDEITKRKEICLRFERKLKLDRYLRNKKNEERMEQDRYIRINSKTLKCSYQVPAEDALAIIKGLFDILGPGLRASHRRSKSQYGSGHSDDDERRREKKNYETLKEWTRYTDFTVNVTTNVPTVLWLDLECLVCKGKNAITNNHSSKHVSSVAVLQTVVDTVFCFVIDSKSKMTTTTTTMELPTVTVNGDNDFSLYVTRGSTCGMHLFFPFVVFNCEIELHRLFSAINTRLTKAGHVNAMIDTGCSAMPLPLSRAHNGLTRVAVKISTLAEKPASIKTYPLKRPGLKDFARITNFYHLVVAVETVVAVDNNGPVAMIVSDDEADKKSSIVAQCSSSSSPSMVLVSNSDATVVPQEDGNVTRQAPQEVVVNKEMEEEEEEEEKEQNNENVMDKAERSSNVSRSSTASTLSSQNKRLVQTDIREVCAKVNETRKRVSCYASETDGSDELELLLLGGSDNAAAAAAAAAANDSTTGHTVTPAKRAKTVVANDEVETDENVSLVRGGGYSSVGVESDVTATRIQSRPKHLIITPIKDECALQSSSSLDLLYVPGDTEITVDGLPKLCFTIPSGVRRSNDKISAKYDKKSFEDSMKLCLNAGQQNTVHETDTQLIMSAFNAEVDFYNAMMHNSTALASLGDGSNGDGLRIKSGSSLCRSREHCPSLLFSDNMPRVLYADDFVTEREWTDVLIKYFDEYLNNAPFLYIMLRVLQQDEHTKRRVNNATCTIVQGVVKQCLARFKVNAIDYQRRLDAQNGVKMSSNTTPKHRPEEKCTIVLGLIAICSLAYDMVTPVFTDLVKTCHQLSGSHRQTLDTLNSSTVVTVVDATAAATATTTTNAATSNTTVNNNINVDGSELRAEQYKTNDLENLVTINDSVSQIDANDAADTRSNSSNGDIGGGGVVGDYQSAKAMSYASIDNNHSILASILRWTRSTLSEQTQWCLFFYYYHVHSDGLTRITDEIVHGGLMVSALLQAYFEDFKKIDSGDRTNSSKGVDVYKVCSKVREIDNALSSGNIEPNLGGFDKDQRLMPPPSGNKKQTSKRTKVKTTAVNTKATTGKNEQYERRHEDAKSAQRKLQQNRGDCRDEDDSDEDSARGSGGGASAGANSSKNKSKRKKSNKIFADTSVVYDYKTDFVEIFTMVVQRYLRPVMFDETKLVYTEAGYDQYHGEIATYFSYDKDLKRVVVDLFNRCTLKYTMPHGDLLLYNTNVMGTVHRGSSCTNNLVLNIFENVYGGCMTYLTRRYNGHLKLFNRFNGDAYRLVVECRHAMNELVRSIELSYVNLLLRQPIVPPVLEDDITIREMYMRPSEIQRGAFVCLNAMDYERAINMFTRHSKFAQDNCKMVETFLDGLIKNDNTITTTAATAATEAAMIDEEARASFRTVYLFFLIYLFEVLYKIRHAYKRNNAYYVSVERLSWDMDVRQLLKLFFGDRDFVIPQGLGPKALRDLHMTTTTTTTTRQSTADEHDSVDYIYYNNAAEHKQASSSTRCVNTRPLVSTKLPDKMSRMMKLFGRKGLVVMKSYTTAAADNETVDGDVIEQDGEDATPDDDDNNYGILETSFISPTTPLLSQKPNILRQHPVITTTTTTTTTAAADGVGEKRHKQETLMSSVSWCRKRDREFLDMNQSQLEDALFSAETWYENCCIRSKALHAERARLKTDEVEVRMEPTSMETFLQTQLRTTIDYDRLNHIHRAVCGVNGERDFDFCTLIPLRVKVIALVLATHSVKRLVPDVGVDFLNREYRHERLFASRRRETGQEEYDDDDRRNTIGGGGDHRPDHAWHATWKTLLCKRKALLAYCRQLAEASFPENYFVGLRPDETYDVLYNFMDTEAKTKRNDYTTFSRLRDTAAPWVKDVCVALNYLLVMNAYDSELVELCLRLFLGFEWPGQWAKRIFVWKSNSNAGKSFFFEHIISKAFDQSTCINDPKGGKENAPEKSEYYKNFVLMINEFSAASAIELKKLCSTSSYKFRMNFGNQMIQAFMTGKMVFNCNTLPLTTDHATIQRVALVPLSFWFQKRQSVVDSMLNWTRDRASCNEYHKNFNSRISAILKPVERRFFIDHRDTKNEDVLFNSPDGRSLQLLSEMKESRNLNARASTFLVQNKTSDVYMLSNPPTGAIISGIMLITRYFCRFRFFNNIKEPVDYTALPTASKRAAQDWQRISQPYFDWKERYRVHEDHTVRTRVSVIHASLNHFVKNCSSKTNTSFFHLQQFFECDFADHRIPNYSRTEDEYNVRLDPLDD